MQEEHILDNVAARSEQIFSTLHKLQKDPATAHLIAEVRGLGLMVGIEFNSPSSPYTPATGSNGKTVPEGAASKVQKKCLEKGMMTLTTSVFQTIRFIPPLTISEQDMAKACTIIEESVREVAAEA